MEGVRRLTQQELACIDACLRAEELAIKKCHTFAQLASDPEVAEICRNMANKHQQHYNALLKHIQQVTPHLQ